MPDYRSYCSFAGITNREMVAALQEKFPKYAKPTQTMVCDPAGYAVQLVKEAEAVLVERFGTAPGLAFPAGKRRSHNSSLRPRRIYARVTERLYSRMERLQRRMSFATMQDLVEAALFAFCEKYDGGVL